jgi:hypothetical protein
MMPTTLLKYLVGNRQAILDVAASRGGVYVGLLFVLAAALAREYDGEDFLRRPWHLVLPLAASLATSAFLYLLLHGLLALRSWKLTPRLSYRALLTLYWMTAPLALLYAIPVERFLSAADATRANLALLGLVSLWRVLLITRALSVVYQVSFFRALFPVMLFADTVALFFLLLTPLPIIGLMGGIRPSESELIIHGTAFLTAVLGFYSWPVWAIGAIVACNKSWQVIDLADVPPRPVSRPLWLVTGAVVAVWALVLPFTQREQQLRRQAEDDLRGGRIRKALLLMSDHERDDFPPYWDPPPRIAYREESPDIIEVQEHLDVLQVKAWVRQIYAEKFGNSLRGNSYAGIWSDLTADEIERRIAIIERLPERDAIIREHSEFMEYRFPDLPSPLRERIERLVRQAGVEIKSERAAESDRSESNPPYESPSGPP